MAAPRVPCLLRVKRPVAESVEDLLGYVDLCELRFKWPSAFIFFCGGASSDVANDAVSLRHYLLKERKIEPRLDGQVILAEAANQLYRDSSYTDLITYEEDIAKISRVILLIAESAGSLAELGAFSSSEQIKKKLSVLMQQKYFDAESFVRFGPIKRLQKEDETRVAFFPWRVNGKGRVIKASIKDHVPEIVRFINEKISAVPDTFQFGLASNKDSRDFALVLWMTGVAQAITADRLSDYAGKLGHPITRARVLDCFYCMKLAGWMDLYPYSGSTYLIRKSTVDVVDRFAFKDGAKFKDVGRWTALTQAAIKKETGLSQPLLRTVMEMRDG
jgi:hypothetical protein